jgi:serine/threonine protein kinase
MFVTWPPRPFRELVVTEEVRRRGIPTVEVYAACVERSWGPFYRGWLVTRQLQGSQDLWTAVQDGGLRKVGANQVLQAVATSLRALHREGVYHRDLNLKNILVRCEPDGVRGYIIDFDRAILFVGEVPMTLARSNLGRLLRLLTGVGKPRALQGGGGAVFATWEWFGIIGHAVCRLVVGIWTRLVSSAVGSPDGEPESMRVRNAVT